MALLTNVMNVEAKLNDIDTTAISTVTVDLGNMTLIKKADKEMWSDGALTYTVTLENIEDSNLTDIVFSDQIDITKCQLDTSSVTLNGNPLEPGTGFEYDPDNGALKIEYEPNLTQGETITITFRVNKV